MVIGLVFGTLCWSIMVIGLVFGTLCWSIMVIGLVFGTLCWSIMVIGLVFGYRVGVWYIIIAAVHKQFLSKRYVYSISFSSSFKYFLRAITIILGAPETATSYLE